MATSNLYQKTYSENYKSIEGGNNVLNLKNEKQNLEYEWQNVTLDDCSADGNKLESIPHTSLRHGSVDVTDGENLSVGSWTPNDNGIDSFASANSTDDCCSELTNATDMRSEDITFESDKAQISLQTHIESKQNESEIQLSVSNLISMTNFLRMDSMTYSTSSAEGGIDNSLQKNHSKKTVYSEAEFEEISLNTETYREVREMDDESYRQNVCGQIYELEGTGISLAEKQIERSKDKSLAGVFLKNLFTKKAKTSNSVAVTTTSDSIQAEPRIGFQLFNALGKLGKGKFEIAKANGTVNKDTTRKLDDNKQAVRKQDISVPSTTALILQERPQNLPPKQPQEKELHTKLYEEMVKSARVKELQEIKEHRRQMELQKKREDEMSERVRIWKQDVLPNWSSMHMTKRVIKLCHQGIPPSIRGQAWRLAIGNELSITHDLYQICEGRAHDRLKVKDTGALLTETDSVAGLFELPLGREASIDVVKLDVARTFPQLGIFQKGGPYHDPLQSLLAAYVCYRPDVGYVQGMSYIAAVLLLNMDGPEAFVCFANLLNQPFLLAFFRQHETTMKIYFAMFGEFLAENMPQLSSHFVSISLSPDIYILDWIFTMFARALPLDVTMRLWDVFFWQGEEFLFRTALGILRLHEDILLHMDFIHCAQFLTQLPDNVSADDLFASLSHIKMSVNKRSFNDLLSFHSSSHAGESNSSR